jgi:hypothetical protein
MRQLAQIGSFDENLILQIAPDEVETFVQEPLPDGTMHGDLEEPTEQDAVVGASGFDPLIQAEVIRKQNADGNVVSCAHKNPWLDSCVYEIKFLGGCSVSTDAGMKESPIPVSCSLVYHSSSKAHQGAILRQTVLFSTVATSF